MKVGTTRRMVSRAHGNRCGQANLSILENLVIFIMALFLKDFTCLLSEISNMILSYKYRSYLVVGPCKRSLTRKQSIVILLKLLIRVW